MLDALAAAGADLTVRLNGRTLLHLAARDGNLEVVIWLIDRGADVEASNDCPAPCPERGQRPLHDALAFNDDATSSARRPPLWQARSPWAPMRIKPRPRASCNWLGG